MLIEFYGKNYGCFRDEFRLSMLATEIDPKSERGIVKVDVEGDKPLRLLRAAAIYGPNASGKSTILRAAKALALLLDITPRLPSDAPLEPYEPFALGPESSQPTVLGATAVINGVVYSYRVSFDRVAIHEERLEVRRADGRAEALFDRKRQHATGSWTDDDRFALVLRDFRENALLLPLADSLAPRLAEGAVVGFRRLLEHSDPLSLPYWMSRGSHLAVAARAKSDNEFNAWLLARLRKADVGVVDLEINEATLPRHGTLAEILEYQMSQMAGDKVGESTAGKGRNAYRMQLRHGGTSGAIAIPYARESLGTQRLVESSPLFFELTHRKEPMAAFVDELDASMHPLLLREIIEHLNCRVSADAVRGQLIFATHEMLLLDDEARDAPLRRDQVYFAEKGPDGASRLYSVAEFQERNNLNIRRRYLQGRYGALPALGSFSE